MFWHEQKLIQIEEKNWLILAFGKNLRKKVKLTLVKESYANPKSDLESLKIDLEYYKAYHLICKDTKMAEWQAHKKASCFKVKADELEDKTVRNSLFEDSEM